MADNTDEEHLENPINNQSEIPPDQIIPPTDSEAINSAQETENMEVHHHAHDPAIPHHKKNWKSYFWEFLMLFLAVFCGFLAEYQLEHKIESDRAKELAQSFYAEIKLNSDAVNNATKAAFRKDSAIQYLKQFLRDSNLTSVSKEFTINYQLALTINRPVIFEPRDAVLNLLINSGSLRYFKNKSLQNSIIELSTSITEIKARNQRAIQYIADNIDPFIIEHNDDEYFDEFNKLGLGVRRYQESNIYIPFDLKNADKIDKVKDINRISLFTNITKGNASFYYKAFDSLNTKLISELKNVYKIN